MTPDTIIILIFGIVILVQLWVIYVLYGRIRQLLDVCGQMGGRMDHADNALEEMAKNVEELK